MGTLKNLVGILLLFAIVFYSVIFFIFLYFCWVMGKPFKEVDEMIGRMYE